jgi:hypothetical protein
LDSDSQPSSPENFAFPETQISLLCAHPASIEGRSANRHQTWSAGCDGREEPACNSFAQTNGALADGKIVQARRPSGRCQVSWVNNPQGDGDNKARSLRGEHEISRKPSRREGRVAPVEPVVSLLVCFHFLHARLRVRPAPGFPCALCSCEGRRLAKLGQIEPRERTVAALLHIVKPYA